MPTRADIEKMSYEEQIQAIKSGKLVNINIIRRQLEMKIISASIEQKDVVAAYYLAEMSINPGDIVLYKRVKQIYLTRKISYAELEKRALA